MNLPFSTGIEFPIALTRYRLLSVLFKGSMQTTFLNIFKMKKGRILGNNPLILLNFSIATILHAAFYFNKIKIKCFILDFKNVWLCLFLFIFFKHAQSPASPNKNTGGNYWMDASKRKSVKRSNFC